MNKITVSVRTPRGSWRIVREVCWEDYAPRYASNDEAGAIPRLEQEVAMKDALAAKERILEFAGYEDVALYVRVRGADYEEVFPSWRAGGSRLSSASFGPLVRPKRSV